jgi:hypothetical protein
MGALEEEKLNGTPLMEIDDVVSVRDRELQLDHLPSITQR